MVEYRSWSKCAAERILVHLVCIVACMASLQSCASEYYLNEPICVAYIHHGTTNVYKDAKWFTGKYARISPNRDFLDGLTGYVWSAKQSDKLFDKDKPHLPWGYYYVDLEIGDIGYYLKGMAI